MNRILNNSIYGSFINTENLISPYSFYIHKAMDICKEGIMSYTSKKIKTIADLLYKGYDYDKILSYRVNAIALTKPDDKGILITSNINSNARLHTYMDIVLFGIDGSVLYNPEISKLDIL